MAVHGIIVLSAMSPAADTHVGRPTMKIEEFRIICDTVIKLTELRQNECKHLCVENFASDCLAKLISTFNRAASQQGGKLTPKGTGQLSFALARKEY